VKRFATFFGFGFSQLRVRLAFGKKKLTKEWQEKAQASTIEKGNN